MIRYILNLKIALITILAISNSIAKSLDDFPLWGSRWIVAEGNNKRIYPSVLPLIPSKIIVINFSNSTDPQDRMVDISWVNLQHKDWWGTAEVVQKALNDLKKRPMSIPFNKINTDSAITIAYQPFDDTLWSINEAIIEEFNMDLITPKRFKEKKKRSEKVVQGLTQLRSEISDKSAYTKSNLPHVRRPITAADKQEFTLYGVNRMRNISITANRHRKNLLLM